MINEHPNISSTPDGLEIIGNNTVNSKNSMLIQVRNKRAAGFRTAQLNVYVRYASGLKDTDRGRNLPDPYVRVKAVDYYGHYSTKRTRSISGTTSPRWYQLLNFGCGKWSLMHIKIWDKDRRSDDAMSNNECKKLYPGAPTFIRHPAHRGGCMYYDYQLTVDYNDCAPNPCQNEGTCSDGCCSYTCHCRPGYIGTRCEYKTFNLVVSNIYARNRASLRGCKTYIEFKAVDMYGFTFSQNTTIVRENCNPTWHQSLNFGRRAWRSLKIQTFEVNPSRHSPVPVPPNQTTLTGTAVWVQDQISHPDNFPHYDIPICSQKNIVLSRPVTAQYIIHICFRGYVAFRYSLN